MRGVEILLSWYRSKVDAIFLVGLGTSSDSQELGLFVHDLSSCENTQVLGTVFALNE